jgi:hypothetical protein
MTTEDLVQEYKARESAMTQKEKADLEDQIWNMRDKKGVLRHQWLNNLLGVSTYDLTMRARLQSNRKDIEILWDRLEKDMTLSSAVDLLKAAKTDTIHHGGTIIDALSAVVTAYDKRPYVVLLENNKVARLNAPNRKNKNHAVTDKAATEEPPEDLGEPGESVDQLVFWKTIRKSISDYCDVRLANFDSLEKAAIKRDIEAELKTVVKGLQVRIHMRTNRQQTRISFQDVVRACGVLAMDPPARGQLPDEEIAKKRKRQLAKEYHPDSSGDSSRQELLQGVLEAYNLIVDYRKQIILSETQARFKGKNS